MRAPLAALLLSGILALASCRPSATVRGTTPIANLQPYRGLLVRGTGASESGAGDLTGLLEQVASDRIRTRCAFSDVRMGGEEDDGSSDLILDLTVQNAYRGGSGLIQNENLATVDVKIVLSDGIDEELIGSADIQGKSSGVVVGNESPEDEAVKAVADRVVQILVKSGCAGKRIARARPAKPRDAVAQPISASGGDAAAKAEAENEEGKRLFRSADVKSAKVRFQAAIRLHRDPRYVFNLCLAEEALGAFDAAESACKRALGMKPDKPLADKVKLRLELIAEKRSSGA